MASGFDLPGRAALLARALMARRARRRRDAAAYARHIRGVLDRFGASALPLRAASIEPIGGTRGGFFSCLASGGGDRLFVKCVLSASREARFWEAWRRGEIRTRGAHYVIEPPVAVEREPDLTLMAFAASEAVADRRASFAAYRRQLALVLRAVAEFNADHCGRTIGIMRARIDAALSAPSGRAIGRALGVDPEEARALAATLRTARRRWRPAGAGPICLSHMDLGPGNVSPRDGRVIIRDFGTAGMAPAGADLHELVRYGRNRPVAPAAVEQMVADYCGVFEAKGITIDPEATLRALQTHFAARYTNLRLPSARRPRAFRAAVGLAAALTETPA